MMADIRLKALDALVIMNTAIKNVRLYPSYQRANDYECPRKASLIFLDIFEQEAPIIFAESEKKTSWSAENL